MDLGATKKKRKKETKKSSFNEDKHEEIKGKKDTHVKNEWTRKLIISYHTTKIGGWGKDERK